MTTTGCLRALSDMCVSLSLSLPLNRWREETVGHGEFSHEKKKKRITGKKEKKYSQFLILVMSVLSHRWVQFRAKTASKTQTDSFSLLISLSQRARYLLSN